MDTGKIIGPDGREHTLSEVVEAIDRLAAAGRGLDASSIEDALRPPIKPSGDMPGPRYFEKGHVFSADDLPPGAPVARAVEGVFAGADLAGVIFAHGDATGSDFRGAARANMAVWDHAHLDKSRMDGLDLSGLRAEKASMKRVDFTGSDLRGASMRGCALFGANFGLGYTSAPALLGGAEFVGSEMSMATFDRCDLRGAKFHGSDLSGASFLRATGLDTGNFDKGTRLSGCNFAHVEAYGAQLSGVDLSGSDFYAATFRSCFFEGANLSECRFTGTDIGESDFSGADLEGAEFRFTRNADKAHLSRAANLAGARFTGLRLRGENFNGCKLDGARFEACDLRETHFRGAVLTRTVFTAEYEAEGAAVRGEAPMAGARFDTADLRSAVFSGLDLRGVSFVGADLAGANFDGCDLTGVDFSGAKLTGASFRGANLSGASLTGVVDMEWAAFDSGTVMAGTSFAGANMRGARLDGVSAHKCDFTAAKMDRARALFAAFADCDFTKAAFADGPDSDGFAEFGSSFRGCEWGDRKKKELSDWPAMERDQRAEESVRQMPKKAAGLAVVGAVAAVDMGTHALVIPAAKTVLGTVFAAPIAEFAAHHGGLTTLSAMASAHYAGLFKAAQRVIAHIPLYEVAAAHAKEAAEKAADKGKDMLVDMLGDKLEDAEKAKMRGRSIASILHHAVDSFAERFSLDGDEWTKRFVAAIPFLRADRKAFKAALAACARRDPELRAFGEFSTEIGRIVICHKRAAKQAAMLLRERAAATGGRCPDLVFARDPSDTPAAPAALTVSWDGACEAAWVSGSGELLRKVRWDASGAVAAAVDRTEGGWLGEADRAALPSREAAAASFEAAVAAAADKNAKKAAAARGPAAAVA
jgi:uncharacterized protein YjbI with pentapeptide repeats